MTAQGFEYLTTAGAPLKMWTRGVTVEDEALQQLLNVAALPFIYRHVAAMADCHWGKGATVGSVMATKGAIVPAAVGVDIGCFTGDTEVILADSKRHRLKDLAEGGAEEVVVYSCTPSGRIFGAKATARKTRTQAALIAVEIDNGEVIRCTPDHRFMLRDGNYIEARFLTDGASLMPFYAQLDKEDYFRIQQPNSGKLQRAHWVIARSGLLGDIPAFKEQRTVIHHRNFDEADNTPTNLQFMGNADHSAYHRGLVERNKYWQSSDFEAARIAALAAKASTPEGHAYFAERGAANILAYMQERPDHFREAVAGNGVRGAPHLVSYNTSPAGRAKSSEMASRQHDCPECGTSVRSYIGLFNHRRSAHGVAANHRVVSVRPLAEREDVYCLVVPAYANFALAAGVFVHNCGMTAVQTDLTASDLPDNLADMRATIEQAVPHGRTDNGGPNDRGAWGDVPRRINAAFEAEGELTILGNGLKEIVMSHEKLERAAMRARHQLGTLGTGNHFIEVCLDEAQGVWAMLHSGSRGIGNAIGRYFIEKAKEDMRRWFINLPDADLAYIPQGSLLFDDYFAAVHWAQEFARVNRDLMMQNTLRAMRDALGRPFGVTEMAVDCHHNYVAWEHHFGENVLVTRKGAVRARVGDLGIIPGSMGARSYIVRGKGNADSFHSCAHGAGRAMSRGEAKKRFTLADHAAATAGVECRKDESVLDETPGAYKDVEAVMAAQVDLVDIVHTLKQVLCVKG